MVTWQSLQIGGRLLLSTICDAIAQRPLFIADVSALNPNVLFELGFAIASRRRIWLLIDGTRARAASEFERFQLLTTVGYREFNNSNDLLRLFYADQPYASLEKTVYNDIFDVASRHSPSKILYLKSEIETDASIRMSRKMSRARFSVLVDDPAEMRIQSLGWYARNANSALGVVAHLLDQEAKNATFHNAKLAVVIHRRMIRRRPTITTQTIRHPVRTRRRCPMTPATPRPTSRLSRCSPAIRRLPQT